MEIAHNNNNSMGQRRMTNAEEESGKLTMSLTRSVRTVCSLPAL